jgi:hypothetical protein
MRSAQFPAARLHVDLCRPRYFRGAGQGSPQAPR